MAIPLVSLDKLLTGSDIRYKLTLVDNARVELEKNFQGPITPVLFVRQDSLASNSQLPAEFATDSEEVSAKLMMWPKPVAIGGKNLLLMDMWYFNPVVKDEEEKKVDGMTEEEKKKEEEKLKKRREERKEMHETVQRSLSVFLSISAYCIARFQSSLMYEGLNVLQNLYGELQKKRPQKIHFGVIQPSKSRARPDADQKNKFASSFMAQFTTFFTNEEWQHPDFFDSVLSHGDVPNFTSIENLIDTLQTAVRFSNVDLDREFFVQHFPLLSAHDCPQFEELLVKFEKQQEMLENAIVCNFIMRGNDGTLILNENFFGILRTNFDDTKPTVVISLMGEPGVGKSTFLNHLIQRAFHYRYLHEYFKVGNTQGNTTQDSWALSCPLSLLTSENQMLLIDLQGLGGMEARDAEEILQQNLVSGVMSITSVPCIVIHNSKARQYEVNGYVDKLVSVSRDIGFQYEKMYFFFHDKDFRCGEQDDSVLIREWIQRLNTDIFCKGVVTVLNKPQFTVPDKAEMRLEFLDRFLTDCNYPKTLNTGVPHTSIEDLINRTSLIALHRNTNLVEISRNLASIDSKGKRELANLETLFNSTKCEMKESLVRTFDNKYSEFLATLMGDQSLTEESKKFLRSILDSKAKQLREKLIWIEADCRTVQSWGNPEGEIKNKIKEYYADCYYVGTFNKKCESLRERLMKISERYIEEKYVIQAVNIVDSYRKYLNWWFYGHYAVQGALVAGTVAFSVAAVGACSITIAGVRTTAIVMRGASAAGCLATGIGEAALFFLNSRHPISIVLFTITQTYESQQESDGIWSFVSSGIRNLLGQGSQVARTPTILTKIILVKNSLSLFRESSSAYVVLVIAHYSMPVAEALNSFIEDTLGIQSEEANKFHDGEGAQVIAFHSRSCQMPCIFMFFTIQKTIVASTFQTLFSDLLGHVSVCCLCEGENEIEGEKNLFAENLLSKPDQYLTLRTKLFIVLKQSLPEEFKVNLRTRIRNASHRFTEFQAESLNEDHSRGIFKSLFNQQIRESRSLKANEVKQVGTKIKEAAKKFL